MTILALLSFLLLFGYLGIMAHKHGIPDMVSDTYYQLGKHGWIFSLVLSASAILIMVPILDSGLGLQPAAFIGTAGLTFVALAPNYLSQDEYTVHKSAAIIAAADCLLWCLSVNAWPTLAIGSLYALYLIAIDIYKSAENVWWLSSLGVRWHPWYWAEVACFADVFATWWAA